MRSFPKAMSLSFFRTVVSSRFNKSYISDGKKWLDQTPSLPQFTVTQQSPKPALTKKVQSCRYYCRDHSKKQDPSQESEECGEEKNKSEEKQTKGKSKFQSPEEIESLAETWKCKKCAKFEYVCPTKCQRPTESPKDAKKEKSTAPCAPQTLKPCHQKPKKVQKQDQSPINQAIQKCKSQKKAPASCQPKKKSAKKSKSDVQVPSRKLSTESVRKPKLRGKIKSKVSKPSKCIEKKIQSESEITLKNCTKKEIDTSQDQNPMLKCIKQCKRRRSGCKSCTSSSKSKKSRKAAKSKSKCAKKVKSEPKCGC